MRQKKTDGCSNLFALLSLVLPFLMTLDSSLRGCILRIPEVSYCIGVSISMVPNLYSLIRSCMAIALKYPVWSRRLQNPGPDCLQVVYRPEERILPNISGQILLSLGRAALYCIQLPLLVPMLICRLL